MQRLLAVLAVLMMALPAKAEDRVDPILANSLTAYVRPSYDALASAAGNFSGTVSDLCASPDKDKLVLSQNAFKDMALAWSKIEWFREGAVMDENRSERIYYFPDRKGVGLKQIQAALAADDQSVTTPETLVEKSVAMQGLGAAEYLLFGTGSDNLATKDGAFACSYLLASANAMGSIATDLQSAWADETDASQFWLQPAKDNPFFRSDAEAANVLIGTLIHGLEAVKDMRLAAFIGKTPEADKPKLAAFWRSNLTFPSIAANLEGLENFYTASTLATLLPDGNEALLRTITFDFAQAVRAARTLDKPVAEALSDAELRQKAAYLQLTVQIMIDHFNKEFAPAAGLDAGFSFGDGD